MDNTFAFSHLLKEAESYSDHLSNVEKKISEDDQSEDADIKMFSHYSRLNIQRMRRWDKVLELNTELVERIKSIDVPITFLVISEVWCGDAAHVLPLLQKLTNLNDSISHLILHRDENPELINAYLTNGSKSIPIVIALENKEGVYKEIFKWGPCPEEVLELKKEYKMGKTFNNQDDYLKAIQMWYNNDKSVSIQNELLQLLKQSI